jgi:predicted nucleotide-binding protein
LNNYDGHPFPRQDIALNVLEDLGVPREKANDVFLRIENSARVVGLLEDIKGKSYVSLQGVSNFIPQARQEEDYAIGDKEPVFEDKSTENLIPQEEPKPVFSSQSVYKGASLATAIADDERRRKVFITHGKNRELVDPIKKLLEFGELVPVVSVERQSVSKPVPEKVMDDMRKCGAAIIHVDIDRTIIDKEDQEHVLLNPNVLIEIGAAMAFYGRRFILLVKDGIRLPSNLQGLYEVRYSNDVFDAGATIRLLEAIKDIKNYSLPSDVMNGDM